MTNFLLIIICLASGMLLRSGLPKDAHRGINTWVLYIALPAISFKYIPHINWGYEMLFPVLAPVIVWLGGYFFIRLYARFFDLDKATWGALTLTTGLSNTSFLGFPLVAAYYGEDAISIAIICDQINFIIFSTAGFIVTVKASGRVRLSFISVVKKILKFPPFAGFAAALVIPVFIDISVLDPLFNTLAGTVAPLALFSIGLQLRFGDWKAEKRNLGAGLFYKLLIAPLLVVLTGFIMGFKGTVPQVSVFEAAMPSLVTSSVLIEEYKLNTRLANLMIGFGIMLAFGTTAFWWMVTGYLL